MKNKIQKISMAQGAKTDKTSEVIGRLYDIRVKLLGIGELIKFQNGEALLEQEEVNYGIGLILTDLAEELGKIRL